MSLNTLLGIKTDFSLGESALPSEEVAAIAKRLDQSHIAFADTMTISGLIDITRSCAKHNIEVHAGVQLRIVDDLTLRGTDGKNQNRRAYYIKAWPKNDAGMEQIYKLLSLATEEDHFFYVSRLTLADVFATLGSGDVVISTGDRRGLFSRPDYDAIFTSLSENYDVFVELVPVPLPYYERMNLNAHALMQAHQYAQAIVTLPTLYDDGKSEALKLNMAIQGRGDFRKEFTFADPQFKGFNPKTHVELIDLVKKTIAGMKVSDPTIDGTFFQAAFRWGIPKFLEETAYRWKKHEVSLPKLVEDAPKAVKDACIAGVRTRLTQQIFGFQPTPEVIREQYIPRLKYELEVLTTLGFCDYFLVVSDLVNWAKSDGIMVGPGRGSIGGSLVSFLMGITDIDPIRFGLLFERFINPSRNDLPDADLDFMSSRREEIIAYLERKYGADRVTGINNYGVLQAANSIKDVARVYGVDMTNFAASKFIPQVHGQAVSLEEAYIQSADIQRFADANTKVWAGAIAVQGMMRQYGRHAAGTIVSGVPVVTRGVIERDGASRKINWDMRVCEDQGLVKFDVLGLSTLDTLSRAVSYIKDRHSKRVDLLQIPLDDEKTLKSFSTGQTHGVFQFEGGAARRILKDMAQTSDLTFDDIVAANALNRPGPIEAGLVKAYVEARNGARSVSYPHPNTEDSLKETFGVLTYQEQVMRISVDLSGFSLPDADKLRKAMGKKDPVLMASFRKQFVDGAVNVSAMDAKEADALFTMIEGFAGYAFNKSHAAEYSLISYQCMWLKVHYPVEFYAAALSTVDEKKLQVIVNDAAQHGIKLVPPDINISTNEFVIGNDTTLYMPFNRIKGVSDKGGQAIVDGRNKSFVTRETKTGRGKTAVVTIEQVPMSVGRYTSREDFEERVEKRVVNSKVRDNLDLVGALSRIVPGQRVAIDSTRRKDQMILLPGLMTGVIVADRVLPRDEFTVAKIDEIRKDVNAVDEELSHAAAAVGNRAKFMVVSDCPTQDEERAKRFTEGQSFQFVAAALKVAELSKGDAYWTALVKKRKVGKSLTPSEIKTYQKFLDREVELLKPPVILTLGSAAARYFVPDLKGDMMDHVGRTFYSEKMDAMIVIGFNPMMIHFDNDKFDILAECFELVRTMIIE